MNCTRAHTLPDNRSTRGYISKVNLKMCNLIFRLLLMLTVFSSTIIMPCLAQSNPELRQSARITVQDIKETINHSRQLYKRNQADSAIQQMLYALELSSRIQYRPGMDSSLVHLINYLLHWNRTESTSEQAEVFAKAIEYVSVFTDKHVGLSWLHDALAGYYLGHEKYFQALLELERALKALPGNATKNETEMKITINTSLSGLWSTLGETNEALKALRTAEQLARSTNDYHRLSTLLQHKGLLYFNNDQFDSAYAFLHASAELSAKHKNAHPKGCKCRQYTLANFSQLLVELDSADRALEIANREIAALEFERSERATKGFNVEKQGPLLLFLKYVQGYAHYKKKSYQHSLDILTELLPIVEHEGVGAVTGNIHEVLALIYEARGDYKNAYRHQVIITDLKASKKAKEEKSKLLALHYSLEKVEAMAQKQLLISQQQTQLKEKNFWIAVVSLGSLFLAASLYALYRNFKNKQRLQDSMIINLQQEKEIEKLQARVEGEEQERSRIAHELHDGIVSQLLALKLNVNALQLNTQDTIQPFQLNDIALQLEEATQDLRQTAHNLMPDLLLRQGLCMSAAALIEKVNRTSLLEAEFQMYGDIPRLSPELELKLYRMVQELVQNTLKHAAASQLLVQISYRDHLLSITVEDNGRGMPTPANSKDTATGLAHIQKTVAELGGSIDIQSKPGTQTTIYLEFDIRHLEQSSAKKETTTL
jgi:two-component system NarL family sensor kinase